MNFFYNKISFSTGLGIFSILFLLLGYTNLEASEIPSPIPFQKALSDAQHIASMNPNWILMEAEGNSMNPHYSSNDLIIIEKSDFDDLRPGMVVVYKDKEGDYVGHIILEKTPEGFIAQGFNNSNKDPQLVTKDNYIGTLFATFHYASHTRTAFSQFPIVYGKTY